MECTLYLTDDCNLKCSYCYEGNKKSKSYMTEATLQKVLDFIAENNFPNDPINLLLLGGEPLLNKKALFKTIDIINEKYPEIKHLFRFQMTTNGILLDDSVIDFVEKNQVELSVSIDGDKETHNLNRKSVNGKDVYDIIFQNMQKLIKRGIRFAIRMTVTTNNVHLFYHNVQYFYELGIRKINVGIDELGEWDENSLQILEEQLELLDEFYLEYFADDENAVFNLHDYKLSTFVFKRKALYCSAGSKGHLVINSKGEFYPCGYVANDPLWKQGSVDTAFDRTKFFNIVRSHTKKESSCKNCNIAFTCCGAKCGFLNFSRTGFLNMNHEMTCRIQRILYNHNVKVFEELYRNYNKKITELLQMALNEQIPIGEPMLQIIQKVEQERGV
uniref:radical SAM protein n=1 Tax=Agathobacter sp. TaxID=2021311 RepID=UPI0040576856